MKRQPFYKFWHPSSGAGGGILAGLVMLAILLASFMINRYARGADMPIKSVEHMAIGQTAIPGKKIVIIKAHKRRHCDECIVH